MGPNLKTFIVSVHVSRLSLKVRALDDDHLNQILRALEIELPESPTYEVFARSNGEVEGELRVLASSVQIVGSPKVVMRASAEESAQ